MKRKKRGGLERGVGSHQTGLSSGVAFVVLFKELSDILWNVCNGGYCFLFPVIGTVSSFQNLRLLLSAQILPHIASVCCCLSFCSLTNRTQILLKNFICTLHFVKLSPSLIQRAGPSFSETVPDLHPAALRILFLLGFVVLFSSSPSCFVLI